MSRNEPPWPTHMTIDDFAAAQKERQLGVRERAVLAVLQDLNSKDERTRQAAVKNLLAMESQNRSGVRGYG